VRKSTTALRSLAVRSLAVGLATAVLLGSAAAALPTPERAAATSLGLPSRIAGADRYETAAAIAGVWDDYFSGSTVFIATGQKFPDALAASAAAAHLGSPVLLVEKKSIPSAVKTRLAALAPERIVVLGSSATISSTVFTKLATTPGSPEVVRWYGADRYATSATIIRKAWSVDGNGDGAEGVSLDTVVMATGRNFPDAATAAAAAGAVGGAVVLVDGAKSSIPNATTKLLRDLQPRRIVIAGSKAAVSSGIEKALRTAFGSSAVVRLGGSDRYRTSARITDYFFDSSDTVFFATGEKFPDALAGAALAGQFGVPLLTAQRSCVVPETVDVVTSLGATERVLLGSTASLRYTVRTLEECPKHSLTDPNSIWVVVNKKRPLSPKDWAPKDLVRVNAPYVNTPYLRSAAATAVEKMFAAYKKSTGKQMQVLSSYRSYASQQAVYTGNDLLTARPGYSEHQTGLAVDVDAVPRTCSLAPCFADTSQGKWLANNAYKYGFILRYPSGKTSVTGYQFEPWHYRYVGVELATAMRNSSVKTLEEYFGLPAAPHY